MEGLDYRFQQMTLEQQSQHPNGYKERGLLPTPSSSAFPLSPSLPLLSFPNVSRILPSPQCVSPLQPQHHMIHSPPPLPLLYNPPPLMPLPPPQPAAIFRPNMAVPPTQRAPSMFMEPPASRPCVLALQIPRNFLSEIKFPAAVVTKNGNIYRQLFQDMPYLRVGLFKTLLEETTPSIPTISACSKFRECSLGEQLSLFYSSQQLSPAELHIRWQVAFDTLYVLREYYPQCEVLVFGSLLTNLATTSSDIDMYADLCGDDGSRIYQVQKHIHGVAKLMRDDVHLLFHKYSKCPHTKQRFAHNLKSMGKRIPFLRFTHGPTNISCDISFGNRISLQNSKLLQFYMVYDSRVRPLLIFLRYWLQFHGLSGELKIKQYALSLMVLAYLMKREILPSVKLLQSLSKRMRESQGLGFHNPDAIEGWDASFCAEQAIVDMAFVNSESLALRNNNIDPDHMLSLLENFFIVYSSVDMKNVVVCAWTGNILVKEAFRRVGKNDLRLMGKERGQLDKYFGDEQPLCIQDPFVREFNVGAVCKQETVQEFQKTCSATCKNLKKAREATGRVSLMDFLSFE